MTGPLWLGILGPLRIRRDDAEVDPGPAQQASLLAVLMARAGQPISTAELIDLIWDQDPPASAVNAIQKYVGNLRRLLEPALPPRETGSYLHRRGGAYLFQPPPGALDLLTFREQIAAARSAEARGDRETALNLYVRALALWRGPAGDGLVHGPAAGALLVALHDEFLTAGVTAAGLATSLGRAKQVLPALHLAASMAPRHEPLHAALITALAAEGDQAQALAVYQEVRDRLARDVGVGPGPEIEAAQHRVLSGSIAPAETAGLVGRLGELAALRQILGSALTGGTGLAVLEGEPGVGKTRLLEELSTEAGPRGALVVWSRCLDGDGTPSMWPWIQAVGAILDALPAAAREKWLADDLGGFLEPPDEAGTLPGLPDNSTQFRLFEHVVAAFREVSALRPVLLIIDDLQWADPTSLRLFGHLASRLPGGTAIVVALRDRAPVPGTEVSRALAVAGRLPDHRRLRLGPLDRAEVAQLLRGETGRTPSPDFVDSVHGRTAGNPFLVRELARLATEAEAVRTGVPATVRDVVGERVAGLDDDTVELLHIAALIGRDVELSLLAAAAGIDLPTCLERLEPLRELGLLEPRPTDPYTVRFPHDLVREAVAARPSLRTAQLHLRIADALEQRGPAFPERLAHHLWSAGPLAEPARTAEALTHAGRRALTRSAFEAAKRHLRSAAQVARSVGLAEHELTVLTLLINVDRRIAGYDAETFRVMTRAEELAIFLGRDDQATEFLYARMIGASLVAHPDTHELARRLRDRGRSSTDPVVRAYGHEAWGTYNWDLGRLGEAYRQLSQVDRSVFHDVGGNQLRRDLQWHAQLILAVVTAMHGELSAALALLEALDEAAGADPYAVSSWAYYAGTIAEMAGDPALAQRAVERWNGADPEHLLLHAAIYLRLTECWARALTGEDPAEAAQAAEELFTTTLLDPPRYGIELFAALICEMWLAAGRPDRAATALAYAGRAPESYADHSVEALVMLARARVAHARGEPFGVVRVAAEQARTHAAGQEIHLFAARAERFLAELAEAGRESE